MENRSKFYSGGLWSEDDMLTRRDHINWALEAYNDKKLDKQELKFIIKNAFVSKIYVSKKTHESAIFKLLVPIIQQFRRKP